MSQSTWIHMALVVCGLLPLSLGAAGAGLDTIDSPKWDMVFAVLAEDTSPAELQVLRESALRTLDINSISVDSSIERPLVRIELDGAPVFDAYFVQDGSVFVIDLYDTIVTDNLKTMIIDGQHLIGAARASLVQTHPAYVTRLEISVIAPCHFAVSTSSDGLTITFDPKPENLDPIAEKANILSLLLNRQIAALEIGRLQEREMYRRSALKRHAQAREIEDSLSRSTVMLKDAKTALLEVDLLAIAPRANAQGRGNSDWYRAELESHETRISQAASNLATARIYSDEQRLIHQRALAKNVDDMHARIVSQHDAVVRALDKGAVEAAFDLRSALHALDSDAQEAGKTDQAYFQSHFAQIEAAEQTTVQRLQTIHAAARRTTESLNALSDTLVHTQDTTVAKSALAPRTDPIDLLQIELSTLSSRDAVALEETGTISEIPQPLIAASLPQAVHGLRPLAALTNLPQSAQTPPRRRAAPPVRDLAISSPTPTAPIKMEFLKASPGQVNTAQRSGQIVLAQQAREPEVSEAQDVIIESPPVAVEVTESRGILTSTASIGRRSFDLVNSDLAPEDDPLRQLVNIDFREMDLANVVSLLADKAKINVLAGAELAGTVTANLTGIPLGRAIEIVLRKNGLGIIEEDGVFVITTFEEAVASRRETRMIFLKNAAAEEVKSVLLEVIGGAATQGLVTVAASDTSNIVILSGPSELVEDFEEIIRRLDIADPVIPTITATIKLNYSDPEDLAVVIQGLVSDVGQVAVDTRSRQLIVTDLPIKVEMIRQLITELDLPVKQVSIEAMIVDALLADDAQTGIDWIVSAVRRRNNRGEIVGNVTNVTAESDFTTGPVTGGLVPGINLGAQLALGILSGDIDISAVIAGEVQSDNATLLASPVIMTVENHTARISIAEEIPFQELTQSTTGPPISTTEFKEVGTILEVTPKVTHENTIIIDLNVKQSDTKGESVTGVPPEDKREAETQVLVRNGQTIFIGGLRRVDDESSVRKVPFLGNIPVLGTLFRSKSVVKENLELLIFLTSHVVEQPPELTPQQKLRYDSLGGATEVAVDAERALFRGIFKSERDPFYKWRRSK